VEQSPTAEARSNIDAPRSAKRRVTARCHKQVNWKPRRAPPGQWAVSLGSSRRVPKLPGSSPDRRHGSRDQRRETHRTGSSFRSTRHAREDFFASRSVKAAAVIVTESDRPMLPIVSSSASSRRRPSTPSSSLARRHYSIRNSSSSARPIGPASVGLAAGAQQILELPPWHTCTSTRDPDGVPSLLLLVEEHRTSAAGS